MKKRVLDAYESQKFLAKYIPIIESEFLKDINKLKVYDYPFVVKLVSDKLIHKSDVKAVKIINNHRELKRARDHFFELSKKNTVKGYLVQKFIKGQELIIGIKKDETFGHVILFGLGGVFTEVINDISIRKCPIDLKEAEKMINELQSSKMLYGARGEKFNLKLLKSVLVKVSNIPLKHKNIKELDINPFILNETEGKAVDARIVLN